MKSQKKRDPAECDDKLYALWKAWQKAFPGATFNKFHGLFCTVRHFVHKYHMTGRLSEEGNKSFNSTLDSKKGILKSMPATVGRVSLVNARTQGNLNGEVLAPKLKVANKCQGSKRGCYKARVARDVNVKMVSSVVDEVVYNGEQYFRLPSGNLLPEKWRDMWEWFAGRVAPQAWRDALAKTALSTMMDLEKVKERHLPW